MLLEAILHGITYTFIILWSDGLQFHHATYDHILLIFVSDLGSF